jgi:hypothetical protein
MFSLFKKKQKRVLDDPVFGRIEFDLIHGIDIWSYIPKDGESPMLCIDASSLGPSDGQREFYCGLKKDLPSRELECKAFISQCETKPINLIEMAVYAINIGTHAELASGQFEIELSDKDANEIHRVVFKNWKPSGYEIDD